MGNITRLFFLDLSFMIYVSFQSTIMDSVANALREINIIEKEERDRLLDWALLDIAPPTGN